MKPSLVTALVLLCAACPSTPTADAGVAIEARALPAVDHGRVSLRWKRFRVLQNDLSRALALSGAEVCTERSGAPCATGGVVTLKDWLRNQNVAEADLDAECRRRQGSQTCVDGPYIPFDNPRGVHVITLGGNNALLGGVFEPIPAPIVTTPLATERMVLSACGERAAKDAVGPAVVFTRLDLNAAAVTRASPGVRETVVDGYRRLLARVPTDAEADAVLSVLDDGPVTGAEFARLSCFIIATTEEFLFQ